MEIFTAFQDEALLLARIFLGIMFIIHGKDKLFGEKPILGFYEYLKSENVPIPLLGAFLATMTEFFGGILMIAGLFTEIVAAAMAGTMLVAILIHIKNKDDFKDGWEVALIAFSLAIVLMTTGAGMYSLDALF